MDLFSSLNVNIDEIKSGKTIAGYDFKDFKRLENIIERPNKKPLIYCAKVFAAAELGGTMILVFDDEGVVNNPDLTKCNIDLTNCQ